MRVCGMIEHATCQRCRRQPQPRVSLSCACAQASRFSASPNLHNRGAAAAAAVSNETRACCALLSHKTPRALVTRGAYCGSVWLCSSLNVHSPLPRGRGRLPHELPPPPVSRTSSTAHINMLPTVADQPVLLNAPSSSCVCLLLLSSAHPSRAPLRARVCLIIMDFVMTIITVYEWAMRMRACVCVCGCCTLRVWCVHFSHKARAPCVYRN